MVILEKEDKVAEPCTLNMVVIMIVMMAMVVIMMGAHHMIMMTMNMIMMSMVKMKMMICSLTQERREDILSRLTPTTCNIVKQSSHHNLTIMHQVDIFNKSSNPEK